MTDKLKTFEVRFVETEVTLQRAFVRAESKEEAIRLVEEYELSILETDQLDSYECSRKDVQVIE
jgi:hypothetical protein